MKGARDPVRDVGSRRQLFVDDYLIASLHGLKRSFHPAAKHGHQYRQCECGVQQPPGTFTFRKETYQPSSEAQHGDTGE